MANLVEFLNPKEEEVITCPKCGTEVERRLISRGYSLVECRSCNVRVAFTIWPICL